jgi:hypothetical protein
MRGMWAQLKDEGMCYRHEDICESRAFFCYLFTGKQIKASAQDRWRSRSVST